MESLESPGGSVKKRYVRPDGGGSAVSRERGGRILTGAPIAPASEATQASGEQNANLIAQLQAEKKKNRSLERRLQALEVASITFTTQLKEKVSQRQLEKENILQILRTQEKFSSIVFASSPDLVDPEWFVALQAKVQSDAACAMNGGEGVSLEDDFDS
jgi:hypothetical protein